MCSRGRQASTDHARHAGQDTVVVPYLRCGSFLYHKSVGGRGCGQQPDAFSPIPSCRGDVANPWLESAFITHVGCLSRHLFVCSQSIAIACVSLRVSPSHVFLLLGFSEYRHCLCFPQSIAIACFFCWFSQSAVNDDLAVFFIPSVCRTEFLAMQCTLAGFVVGAGAQRGARLEEEDASLAWRTDGTSLAPVATCPRTWCWEALRRSDWRERLGRLIDAMDRSVEDLGPEPPAWWGRGQPMQLTMATAAEHVVVQEDIVMAAVAELAGDEPAGDGAGDAAGDGAGDDKPAEPCAKRRKTHVPPEVKEWFCSLTRVMPDWTMMQCLPLRKEGTPILFRAPAHRHTPQVVLAQDSRYRSWPPALPGTRSCPGPGRHRVPRLQQSVAQESWQNS